VQSDIRITVTRQAATAVKQATTTIPVCFLSVPDPSESGWRIQVKISLFLKHIG